MPHKDPLKRREYNKRWAQKKRNQRSLEEKKRISAAISKRWSEQYKTWTPEQKAEYAVKCKRRKLKPSGHTLESFEEARCLQEDHCAICGKVAKMYADHKHTNPPAPRSLLCLTCNAGLGQFYDNPELVRRALEYLVFHEAKNSRNTSTER